MQVVWIWFLRVQLLLCNRIEGWRDFVFYLCKSLNNNTSRMDMVFESRALALQQKRGRDRVFSYK